MHTEKSQEELQKPYQHPSWVETKARAGQFGAPVFFDDEYEQQDEPFSSEKGKTETNPLEQEINQEKEQEEEKKEINLQNKADDDNKNETVESISIVNNSEPLPQPKEPIKKKIVQKPEKKIISTPTKKQNYSAPAVSKPPLTLAQLTQGFLNQRKQDSGTHSISMLGKQGLATDEQLKYERYLQKIGWCIQNSFEINRPRFPSLSQNTTFKIFFAIARSGNLQQLAIHQSSGNMHVDQCVLFVFRDASTSFPPIPNYLPDDPLNIMYTFTIFVGPY